MRREPRFHNPDDDDADDDDDDEIDELSVCPENADTPYSRDLVVSPVSEHFPYSKVSKNRKTTKSLKKSCFQEGLF